MSWVPTTDFEEEIVESQPYHDFIYGKLSDPTAQTFYPRPKQHLDFVQQQKKEKTLQEQKCTPTQNHKLDLIAKIQRIAGTKPLGEQATVEDWDSNENLVRETIALMRHVGFNPSVEEALDEERTIATHPITEDVKINRNGRKHMPIFFGDKFFELKPRVTLSPPPSPTAELVGEENGFEHFNESIGSSCTSNVSNSMSQATSSSNGTTSRNSISDYCKAAEFNNSIEYHMTTENGRATRTSNKNLHAVSTKQSYPKKQHKTDRITTHLSPRTTKTDRSPYNSGNKTQADSYLPHSSNRGPRRDSSSPTNSSSNSSNNFSSRGSSSLSSTDNTHKDRSSNTAFESAIDEVYDDSFETAHNSLHEYRTQRKSNNREDKEKPKHNIDQVIKTESWRNSNIQAENNYHIQTNWRAPTDYRRREQKPHKIKTTLCTPKELYDKKRQSID